MAPFYECGSTASRLQSHYEEAGEGQASKRFV